MTDRAGSDPVGAALADLVREVPRHVVPSDLAAAAWATGRRRRRRTIVRAAIVVALLSGLAVTTPTVAPRLATLPAVAADQGERVEGYPRRIGQQWWIPDLPARPGPVAGVILAGGSEDTPATWYAFTERGFRWHLARDIGSYPALTPDGRRVGYLRDLRGPYVIHDLVTGERTEFPMVDSGVTGPGIQPAPYHVQTQTPGFWSPGGTRVLYLGGVQTEHLGGAVILGVDGSVAVVEGPGLPAGWTGEDTLLWISLPADPAAPVPISVTGLDGRVLRTAVLKPTPPSRTVKRSQWAATVSPDGAEVLVIEEDPDGRAYVRRYSTIDGSPLGEAAGPIDLITACGAAWAGSVPAVPVYWHDAGGPTTVFVTGDGLRPATGIDRTLDASCIVWAGDALAGTSRVNPLELFDWWWGPELPEVLIALLLALALAGWHRWWRRGPRRRAPVSRTSPLRRPGGGDIARQ